MIALHFEEVEQIAIDEQMLTNWVSSACRKEGYTLSELAIICCSDSYLLEINKTYLKHDYFTDIITFDLSEESELIEGELYISLDRIHENANDLNLPFVEELNRVIIHGVLHLLGYKDKTDEEKKIMRSKENAYLSLLPQ